MARTTSHKCMSAMGGGGEEGQRVDDQARTSHRRLLWEKKSYIGQEREVVAYENEMESFESVYLVQTIFQSTLALLRLARSRHSYAMQLSGN